MVQSRVASRLPLQPIHCLPSLNIRGIASTPQTSDRNLTLNSVSPRSRIQKCKMR